MATLDNITHDSGPPLTDYWNGVTDVNARMSVTVASALGGSVEGLQCTHNAASFNTFLTEPFATPASEELRFKWRYDPNGAQTPGSTTTLLTMSLSTAAFGTRLCEGLLDITSGGQNRITWGIGADGGFSTAQTTNITDAEHCFEIAIKRATTNVSVDGEIEFYIDGVLDLSSAIVDNFDLFPTIDTIFVRYPGWDAAQGATVIYMDEVTLTDVLATGLCITAFTPTLAPMTKPVDIDADGSNLYLALLDSGNPILIKMSTALDANGSTVFEPGAGDDIGVQCGRFDADVVWVAGAFDGTNVVEKSEDGGTTFTVKDPGTFGDVEAFVVGPDSDTRVLIADDNIDIQETIDDGTTWTAINSGTGFNVNAVARLPQNVQESVFGNDSGATDNIDYSPNSGGDMEDFSTGFPTEDATRVIVN